MKKFNRLISSLMVFMIVLTSAITPALAAGLDAKPEIARNLTDVDVSSTPVEVESKYQDKDIDVSTTTFKEYEGDDIVGKFIEEDEQGVKRLKNPNGDNYLPMWGLYGLSNSSGMTYSDFAMFQFRAELDGEETDIPLYCLSFGKNSPKDISWERVEEAPEDIMKIMSLGYPFKTGKEYGITDVELEWATALALYMETGKVYTVDKDSQLANLTSDVITKDSFFTKDFKYTFDGEEYEGDLAFQLYLYDKGQSLQDGESVIVRGNDEALGEGDEIFFNVVTPILAGNEEGADFSVLADDIKEKSLEILEIAFGIYDRAKEMELEDVTTVSVDGKAQYMPNLKGEIFGPFKSSEDLSDIEFILRDENGQVVEDNKVYAVDVNGKELDEISSEFYIASEKPVDSGQEIEVLVTSKREIPLGYVFTQDPTMGDYEEDLSDHPDQVMFLATKEPLKSMFTVYVSNPENYELSFYKIDEENDSPLAGAEFKLTKEGDEDFQQTAISNRDGLVSFFGLKEGSYTVEETVAPVGYEKLEDTFTFDVVYNNGVAEIENVDEKLEEFKDLFAIRNKKKEVNTITRISKLDITDGKPVPGAKLEVFKLDEAAEDRFGEKVFEGFTDQDGHLDIENLQPGKYIFKETIAPEGYILSEEHIEFKVNEDFTTDSKVIMYNEPVKEEPTPEPKPTGVELSKSDVTDGKPVPGAKLEVYEVDEDAEDRFGKKVWEGKTGKDGKTEKFELKEGSYIFKETIAPKGYILSEEHVEFKVRPDGKVEGRTHMTNAPFITLSKTDITDGKPVPGAKLEVYKYDKDSKEIKDKVFEGVTDKEGKLQLPKLNPGNYAFKETIAPKGYVLSTETITFTVKDDFSVDGKTHMTNAPNKHVVLHKKDLTTGKPVEGAKIKIWSDDPNVKNFKEVTKTSNKDGELFITIDEPGKYKFKETVAPKGYILNEEEFEFEVEKVNGEFKIYGDTEITNEREEELFDIDFFKKDMESGQKLEGAEYKLYDADKKVLDQRLEFDKYGKGTLKDLKPGDYYLKESKAPKGYKLDDRYHEFTISDSGRVSTRSSDDYIEAKDHDTITLYNDRLDIILKKIDGDTKAKLEGAKFVLLEKVNGEYEETNQEYTSDRDGEINLSSKKYLRAGEYALKEIEAPKGYEKLKEPVKFTIYNDGSTDLTEIKNYKFIDDEIIEELNNDKDEIITPEDDPIDDTHIKPEGITPEDDEYEEEYIYEDEYIDGEEQEVVVDETVQTGQGLINVKTFNVLLLMLSLVLIGVGIKKRQ